jgi:type II secretory pathway component GspD/PulD (secretin)
MNPMCRRCLVPVVLALVAVTAATAQERPAAEPKRGAYVVKYASAKDIVSILAKHFKGAAEIQAGPEGTSNVLLINAPPAVFDEAMKLLDQLDHRPQAVAVEVYLVELPLKKSDDKGKDLDEKQLTGALDDMAGKLEALQKKGQVASVKRIQFTTLEGRPGSLMLGETKPFVTGATRTATGIVSKSITYRMVGTQVRVTPQVSADQMVALDLLLEDNRMHQNEDGPAIGTDDKGAPILATEFSQVKLESKVSVASGKAVLAKDAKSAGKAGQGQLLLVVGARVVEHEKGK